MVDRKDSEMRRQLPEFFIKARRIVRRISLRPAAFFEERKGAVSVELALVVIFFAFIAIGAFDFARYGIEVTRITQAARAGIQYAIQSETTAADATSIEQAIRDDASDTTNELQITVDPPYCGCPGAGAAACGSTCADGGYPPMYVALTVENDFNLFFTFPGLPSTIPVTASSQLRLR